MYKCMIFCILGTVPIFDPRTHLVSCKNCFKGYYQPVDTWSNNTPVCMEKFGCDNNYHKIECTVQPDMELTQDTLCRCDARNGYIVSSSERREMCFPGKFADCIEFKCPDGQERLLKTMKLMLRPVAIRHQLFDIHLLDHKCLKMNTTTN
ncbi:hypothetical protein ACJMK2_003485 [Sinanodonta woodiana]|uniref:Uncharacterized protein n=1 Tax=Sinanodonta woodiana TaxID=1069815 RepID=A0ABD3XZ30_SINWO